jgi:hypothetical protein
MQPSATASRGANWIAITGAGARRGDWVMGLLWFGFEVTYSHMVGSPLFMAMIEDPEWVVDMVNTMLDSSIALLEMVWEAGYRFDGVMWYNDMGYKGKQFMSVSMYRDLFKPADRRAAGGRTPRAPRLLPFLRQPGAAGAGVDGCRH